MYIILYLTIGILIFIVMLFSKGVENSLEEELGRYYTAEQAVLVIVIGACVSALIWPVIVLHSLMNSTLT